MQTAVQVKEQFLTELRALLSKYDTPNSKAEIEAEDHYQGYPECGEDVRMTVNIPSIYDKNGNCLREWTEIDLGRWFSN